MIDLYAAGTSNGMRARIALEECGLQYRWHPVDLMKGENRSPEFLKLNPNAQIPVIVDDAAPGGKQIVLSQSSAIMIYCAEKAGKFIPSDPVKRAMTLEAYMSASTDITPKSSSSIFSRSSRDTNGSGTSVQNVFRSSPSSTLLHRVVLPVPGSPVSTIKPSRRRMPARRASNVGPCERLL